MSNGPKPKKYSEREVSAILRRAADIQSLSSDEHLGERDVTLERLTQAAAEIGIDPEAIQQAAQELLDAEAGRNTKRSAFGVSWDFDETSVVNGEITPESWPQILDELRDFTGRVGTPSSNGAGFEWLSRQPDPLHVSFTPAGDSVKVRVKTKHAGWVGAFYVVPPAITLALTVTVALALETAGRSPLHHPADFIAAIVGAPALATLIGHLGFKKFSARRIAAAHALLRRVSAAVGGARAVEAEQVGAVGSKSVQSSSTVNVQAASYVTPTDKESEQVQVLRQGR